MGVLFAIIAYILWGLLPLYWKMLATVPSLEILSHRVVWSFLLLAVLMTCRRRWRGYWQKFKSRKVLIAFTLSGLILGLNWYLYIWAVNHNHVVDASLGYFINPLINVVFGTWLLDEKLTRRQWLAIAIAGVGVLVMTLQGSGFPWIALALAISFGQYGLLKKRAVLNAVEGLTFESALLMPPALLFLGSLQSSGSAAFMHVSTTTTLLLFFAGVVTTTPLLFFSAAARQIKLSDLGLLQYISPTLQFALGVFVFHEPFSSDRLVGFVLIWAALSLFMMDTMIGTRGKNEE